MPKLQKISQLFKVIEYHLQCVLAVYFIAIVLNAFAGIALQSRLIVLQQQQRNVSHEAKSELQTEITRILDLMLLTGQLFRSSKASAMCFNSMLAAGCIVYILPNLVPSMRVFNYFRGNGIIAYLAEPEVESERIRTKIEKVIQDAIESNINLRNMVIDELDESNPLMTHHLEVPSTERRQSANLDYYIDCYDTETANHYHRVDTQRQRGSLAISREQIIADTIDLKKKKSLVKSNFDGRNFRPIAVAAFLACLDNQLKYLIRLRSQKRKIWLVTKDANWAHRIQLYATRFDAAFLPFIWCWSMLVTYIGVKGSLNAIKSSELGGKYQTITVMDCLSVTNIFISSYFCVMMSSHPYQIFVINILDIFREFGLIKSKIALLGFGLRSLKHLDQKKQMNVKEYELMKRDIYFECEKSAIELYICYRIFRDEMKTSMRVAEIAMSQNVSFVLGVWLPVLPFMNYIITGNYVVVASVMFSIFLAPNISLLICGAVHAYCIKQSKRIWYFIAFAERYNLDKFRSSQLNDQPSNHKERHIDSSIDSNFDFDFGYHLHSVISYHTMFLWRQLAREEEQVQDHFICKLFGAYEVNYRNVIKYNFWILSITLIVLSETLLRN